MNLILGAGLAGLSCSYHLGHQKCMLLEKAGHPYGHIHSDFRGGFTWDEGPHVSFTKNDYVRNLFSQSVDGDFESYEIRTTNYYRGHWVDHPAQSNLFQIPEPLRTQCLDSFLESRSTPYYLPPKNYEEWLCRAFGPVFAKTFPAAYTRKYWTREPHNMTTDWVGHRVFNPNVEDVINGSRRPLDRQTHYITKVRYPRKGGYQAFASSLQSGANIHFGTAVIRTDLCNRCLWTEDGRKFEWNRLINTLPLPVFIGTCIDVPAEVLEASRSLSCSQALLVNVTAPHVTQREENWLYIYDEDKYSTRINFTEKLALANAPAGSTGVQAEVYASRHRPFNTSPTSIADRVINELFEMGLLIGDRTSISHHTLLVPWANVIFDHDTAPALDCIWRWLEQFGLNRESDDLHPLTDWAATEAHASPHGHLVMAGRFGQWKYFWTDDCVLRGKQISHNING